MLSNDKKMEAVLTSLENFLIQQVEPIANKADADPLVLKTLFEQFKTLGLLALFAPESQGGNGFDLATIHACSQLMASYSGALYLLQAQHQGCVRMLAKEADGPAQSLIAEMRYGKPGIGIAISHLRRVDNPPLRGKKNADGYEVSGTLLWASGFNIFDQLMVGFITDDQKEVYCILPFQNTKQSGTSYIEYSTLFELCALTGTSTVGAKIERWQVAQKDILFVKEVGAFLGRSRRNFNPIMAMLGAAQAALRTIKNHEPAQRYSQSLEHFEGQLKQYQEQVLLLLASDSDTTLLRVEIQQFALHVIQAGVLMIGGRATLADAALQRLYRELLQYSVWGHYQATVEAFLTEA